MLIRRQTVREYDRFLIARGVAPAQCHIGELPDRAGWHILESSRAQDRAFKRELRRKAGADLAFGRWPAGLVVEDSERAVGKLLDAVGPRGQLEDMLVDLDVELGGHLGMQCGGFGAPL